MTKKNSTGKAPKMMTAAEFDRHFDEGGEILSMMDLENARRPGREQKRVNVDFPQWVIDSLDDQAARMGVTRQSVIKVWIAERLKQESESMAVAEKPATPRATR